MKDLLLYIFLLSAISFSFSQENNKMDDTFEKLSWIIDNWISPAGESITYENWVKTDDSTFSGESYTIKNGETIFTEQLKLEKINGEVYYTAIVKHNPGPVHFKLIELGENKAVFENPEHDFPNRIIYMLKDDGTLYARIEGKNKKGEDTAGEFFYSRAR